MFTRSQRSTHLPVSIGLTLALLLATACAQSADRTMSRLSAPIGGTDVIIGDLRTTGVQVAVPADAVEHEGTFFIQTSTSSPAPEKSAGSLTGSPYDIDVDSDVKRFDSPLTVTFQLTDEQWDSLASPDDLQIAYYDGRAWDHLDPTEVNGDDRTVSFETYHCSLLSPAEPTEEEIRRQVAHNTAVSDVTIDKNAALRATTESLVKSVMGSGVDTSLLRDIVEGMLDQNDYTQLLKAATNGNTEEFQTQFIASYTQVTANALWAYSSSFAGNLGDLGANLGLVGAFGSSAALVADGDFQAAAEELAKGIIQTNPLGKLLLVAARVTDRQISRWKNQEIEAAYQIFLNGKEPTIPFWGYGSIQPGDFDQIWVEMRGVSRQILIDAAADFTAEYEREPSDAERSQLEADAKATLLAEFEHRQAREQDIATAEEKNLEFLEIARDGNLLTWSRYGFDRGSMSYQDRVRQILDLRNRVLLDTERVLTFGGEDTDTEINAYTVSRLITTFVRDGESAYDKLLVEEGFVDGVDLSKAVGTHQGTLTFSPQTTTHVESMNEGRSTWTSSVQFHDAPITVTVGSDNTISLSYSIETEAQREVVVDYQTGFVSTEVLSWTFVIDESFDAIAFETAPGSSVSLSPLRGDRSYRGTYHATGGPAGDVSWSIDETYVTAVIESFTVSVVDSTLVIAGQTSFEYPELGMGPPAVSSFHVEVETS